jgi:hypothetical protein
MIYKKWHLFLFKDNDFLFNILKNYLYIFSYIFKNKSKIDIFLNFYI